MGLIDTDEAVNALVKWYGCEPIDIDAFKEIVEKLSVEVFGNSEQLKTANWIPCSERMPEEHEWIGTKRFGTTISDEVYVTFESPNGERFTKHLNFQNGKLSSFDQRNIDAFYKGSVPIAWMPLPEPYKGDKHE